MMSSQSAWGYRKSPTNSRRSCNVHDRWSNSAREAALPRWAKHRCSR